MQTTLLELLASEATLRQTSDFVRKLELTAKIVDGYLAKYLRIHDKRQNNAAKLARGLYQHGIYYPSLGGKRLRPFITIMAGSIFGRESDALYMGAVSVELLHNFTLIHDDIMDQDRLRRGNRTAHEKFGLPSALNAGDFLYALSVSVASAAEESASVKGVTSSLASAAMRVAIGQEQDMGFEHLTDVTTQEYLEMIGNKTGALFECAAEIGGIIGGVSRDGRKSANVQQLRALRSYGSSVGLAFQIHDDYLGSFGDQSKIGKPVGSDLRRGKKTCVMVRALESASNAQRELLRKVMGNTSANEAMVKDALNVLHELGVATECQRLAQSYADQAISSISNFKSESAEWLRMLAKYSVSRDF